MFVMSLVKMKKISKKCKKVSMKKFSKKFCYPAVRIKFTAGQRGICTENGAKGERKGVCCLNNQAAMPRGENRM